MSSKVSSKKFSSPTRATHQYQLIRTNRSGPEAFFRCKFLRRLGKCHEQPSSALSALPQKRVCNSRKISTSVLKDLNPRRMNTSRKISRAHAAPNTCLFGLDESAAAFTSEILRRKCHPETELRTISTCAKACSQLSQNQHFHFQGLKTPWNQQLQKKRALLVSRCRGLQSRAGRRMFRAGGGARDFARRAGRAT
jgi:hypothetical protein